MISIHIPEYLHILITLEQLKKEILNQTNENRLTPGTKKALENAKKYFIDCIFKMENDSGKSADYEPDSWYLISSDNKKFSMEPGYYLEIDGVVHLLMPEFKK